VKSAAPSDYSRARHEKDVQPLRELSARLGGNPLLVQASNGNTSIKLDGVIWIKASGKWLARTMLEEMHVAVELAEARECIESGTEIGARDGGKGGPRPSIETAMHVVLRHRVVIHVHSINTIAWAIRLDGPKQLKQRLAGLRWQWIPYVASGIPLAREIQKALEKDRDTDVLVLGNHGLVVCGPDCKKAEALLWEVERRLETPPRPIPKPDTAVLEMIARFSRWQFPDMDALHALGTDAISLKIVKGGVLYPCQAMFLGQTMPLLPPTSRELRFKGEERTPPFVTVEGGGVMLNERMSSAELATLIGLAQVAQRTEECAELRYLNWAEVAQVLHEGLHGYMPGSRETAGDAGEKLREECRVVSHGDEQLA
jgi:rhamnose utilization protein RhaD (predicted bifunctional aldolase and dehydrogenase)